MFHTEEVEILIPSKHQNTDMGPFWLSVGPSLTMIVPILLMTLMNISLGRDTTNPYIYMTLITGGTGCILTAFWGISGYRYRKNHAKRREELIQKEFEDYLDRMNEYLETCRTENREYLKNKYPSAYQLVEDFSEERLWHRFPEDEDFSYIRLGTGTGPFQMKISLSDNSKQMVLSKETKMAGDTVERFRTIDDIPLGIDVGKEKRIGIIPGKDTDKTTQFILNMIVETAFLIDPSDIKICIFADKDIHEQKALVDSIRFLPHLVSRDGGIRLISTDFDSCRRVSATLDHLLDYSEDKYIVWVLSDRFLQEEIVYSRFISNCENVYVFFKNDRAFLPNCVHCFINESEYVCPETLTYKEAERACRRMARIPLKHSPDETGPPSKVDFLELFGIKRIEEYNCRNNWSQNAGICDSLRVPIGMTGPGRKLYLDIHEKAHGPHGLVAGTTGSGKSELLQTYLLSLCLNYSPLDVNFFIIDYKGGGTGNLVDKLPHCAGAVSNLSGNSIGRAMKAVGAENLRRQKLLAQYGVNHIDAYRKLYNEGCADEPLPYMVLIIDEFAELKKEAPDFMSKIISLAAVGRSLGIHLILATQKPAGVVDDKIWSNSRFRMCLRVQDRQDSMDMLHRPEASRLTNPGQCYLQIGNGDGITLFQTGYCGGAYDPDNSREKIYLLDETYRKCESKLGKKHEKGITTLEILTQYIIYENVKFGGRTAKNLWLPELDETIEYDCALTDGKGFRVGRFDDPSNQIQDVYFYNPESDGHLAIGGGPSTGKTTFLKNLILQISSTGSGDEFVAIDVGSENLLEYRECLNCLGVLPEGESIEVFIFHLRREYEARKKNRNAHKLYVFIDNIATLIKVMPEEAYGFLVKLYTEGLSLGIIIISTGNSATDFPAKIFGKIRTTLALEMNDPIMYKDMLREYRLDTTMPRGIPGRGLCRINDRILEFQTFLPIYQIDSKQSDMQPYMLPSTQMNLSARLSKHFPYLKNELRTDDFLEDIKRCGDKDILYIGYLTKTGRLFGIDINKAESFLIIASEENNLQIMTELCKLSAAANNLDSTKYENKVIFINSDRDILKNTNTSKSGICIGKSILNQRFFDFSDVSYSQLNNIANTRDGLARISGKNRTVRVRIPMLKEEDDDDCY